MTDVKIRELGHDRERIVCVRDGVVGLRHAGPRTAKKSRRSSTNTRAARTSKAHDQNKSKSLIICVSYIICKQYKRNVNDYHVVRGFFRYSRVKKVKNYEIIHDFLLEL